MIKRNTIEHCSKVTSLSQYVLEVFRNEPDRNYVNKDLVDITHGNPNSICKALGRLEKSGEIIRLDHGIYKYNSFREDPSLITLIKYGYWRVENLRFVTKRARGDPVSQSEVTENTLEENKSLSKPLPGFPWDLPTGQQVHWNKYHNGTQEIRLSSNKRAPFSPDHVLTLLQILEKDGFGGPEWKCISIEVNVEGRGWTVPGYFDVKIIRQLLLKVYQHGPSLRIEIADRRECSTKEVMSFLHSFVNGFDAAESLMSVKTFENRLVGCEGAAKLALTIARNTRDKLPLFQRASELIRKKDK